MLLRPMVDLRTRSRELVPALLVLLWSTGFIGARLGLPHAEPLTFLTLRYAVAIVLMGAVVLVTGAAGLAAGASTRTSRSPASSSRACISPACSSP